MLALSAVIATEKNASWGRRLSSPLGALDRRWSRSSRWPAPSVEQCDRGAGDSPTERGGGIPRCSRALARRGGLCGDHDASARPRGGRESGLVHYYFGSMENLLVRVLERFTERLIVRQRAMYAADLPFLEKWRQAMRYLDEDFASGYQKVWYELQAMAWNKPELRDRIAHVTEEWREVLADVRAGATRARDRHADRRARHPRGDVQPGDHPRATLRHRHRPPRAIERIDERPWRER